MTSLDQKIALQKKSIIRSGYEQYDLKQHSVPKYFAIAICRYQDHITKAQMVQNIRALVCINFVLQNLNVFQNIRRG